jgi:hypothetical protein
MGCIPSSDGNNQLQNKLDELKWLSVFVGLGFSLDDLYQIYLFYVPFSKSLTKHIMIEDLLNHLGFHTYPVLLRIFLIFDQEEKSGTMDFYEFILVIWNYCTIDETRLGKAFLSPSLSAAT